MKQALMEALLASGPLVTAVGRRVGWDELPQGGGLPAIGLTLVSAARGYTYRGRDRLTGFLVQIDVWAASLASREAAVAAVIAALDAAPGGIILGVFIEAQRDSLELSAGPEPSGGDNLFRTSLDARVWALEP
jgi:hypothetical protein